MSFRDKIDVRAHLETSINTVLVVEQYRIDISADIADGIVRNDETTRGGCYIRTHKYLRHARKKIARLQLQ